MINVHEILDKETAYLFEKCAAEAVDILNNCDYIPEILKYFAYLNRPDVHEAYVVRNNAEPLYTTVLLCTNHKIRCLFHKLTGDEQTYWLNFVSFQFSHLKSFSVFEKKLLSDLEFITKVPHLATFQEYSDLYNAFSSESLALDRYSADVQTFFAADDSLCYLYHTYTAFCERIAHASLYDLADNYVHQYSWVIPRRFTDLVLLGMVFDIMLYKALLLDRETFVDFAEYISMSIGGTPFEQKNRILLKRAEVDRQVASLNSRKEKITYLLKEYFAVIKEYNFLHKQGVCRASESANDKAHLLGYLARCIREIMVTQTGLSPASDRDRPAE